MTNVKTAISLPESLFAQVENLAREMKVSRSREFVMALERFVRDYQDHKLFEQINEAYPHTPTPLYSVTHTTKLNSCPP